VRVDAEQIDPVRNCRSEVSVQEMQRAETDEKKCAGFQKLVDSDEHEAGGMLEGLSGLGHGWE